MDNCIITNLNHFISGYANGNAVTFVHQPIPPMPPLQPMPRFVRPTPPAAFRVYQPHGQELMIEANSNSRHRGLPNLRALPEAVIYSFHVMEISLVFMTC